MCCPMGIAGALAEVIDAEFTGTAGGSGAVCRIAMRTRRRIAGDIDGVLREDTARLECGREVRQRASAD